jgi:hypothetical protein
MSRSHLPRVTHRGGCWTTAAATARDATARVRIYRAGRTHRAFRERSGKGSWRKVRARLEGFTIYRLQLDPRYCADVQARARNETR